ncbi:MAG: glycosyl hydrolase family 95 catalytic domain-containing protein [Bacteroides sp.]
MNKSKTLFLLLLTSLCLPAHSQSKEYSLWYNRPAYNRGGDFTYTVARGFPYDEDWEKWSLPIGNGAMGASIFGRTDTERIQLSEKTLGNKGPYRFGGFTNFAEIYLDIRHHSAKNYKRTLNLNEAISTVSYDHEGVHYTREYFANYPDRIIAVKLKADRPKMISFTLRPEIPYLRPFDKTQDGRTGAVKAESDVITLGGEMQYFGLPYEGQIKVVNFNGERSCKTVGKNGVIEVNNADSVVLYIAAATSYQLNESVFLRPNAEKFKGNEHPHRLVTERIERATEKGYDRLRKEHIADYQHFFNRVDLHLTDQIPTIPTDKLLNQYRLGKSNAYLEELFFQYGRYLLIASSRAGSPPPNLQGAWTQYDYSPWSGGYWHNVNVQMNYWPAFNTNLGELFDSYMTYNEAFRKSAVEKAVEYIKANNPEVLDPVAEENGWTIGTGATVFNIERPGGHSGPGTGGFTTKLFWDYYDFTRDKQLLKEHVYPALLGMSKFLSKTLKAQPDGTLLVDPSSSPEQRHQGENYRTKGCIFDQSMILETYQDLLKASKILGLNDPFLKTVERQIPQLDAIKIGESGQIKEFREEKKYGDIGEYTHRHISHLCAMYPGSTINSCTPEWMKAAIVTLEKRGDKSTGWAMAHRQNLWARAKNGEKAYQLYQYILSKATSENLWGVHPPFQIDANFGATAGVAEMLIQSHEGFIEPLAALPEAWAKGSFKGLKARGNFEVSADWNKGCATHFSIQSNEGELCRLKYHNIGNAQITDGRGKRVKYTSVGDDLIEFKTKKGMVYQIVW